ncbi:LOW QUALITY PROTEIN: uncharacterized protein LOC124279320 [Haliotis rubra]|uniref:LOW QUALITY PROTEIN: uncharacterized protein LOC124279320 n=1 Tax=Haliotis rubra TaxID=36100 RepID=UPI001EE5D56E|nr:LOW QUALITY PROTEIN: uncharacterized protein LOC124279320 [Haliotis rubra]
MDQEACSWRPDSTGCYPGTCQEELASNCNCSSGFSGTNCQNIDTPPVISWNRIVLHGQGNETAEAPVDPNNAEAQEDSWTNLKNIHNINYDFRTSFIPSGLQPSRHTFIDGYKMSVNIDNTSVASSQLQVDVYDASAFSNASSTPHQFQPTTLRPMTKIFTFNSAVMGEEEEGSTNVSETTRDYEVTSANPTTTQTTTGFACPQINRQISAMQTSTGFEDPQINSSVDPELFEEAEVTSWIANNLDLASPFMELNAAFTYKMLEDDFDTLTIPPIEQFSKVSENLHTAFGKATRYQNQHVPMFNGKRFPLHHMRAPDLDDSLKLINDSCNKFYKAEDKKFAQLDTMTRRTFISLPSFNLQWHGWRDDTSGIRRFEFQVFEMEFITSDDGLRMKNVDQMQTFNASQGIFSVEITAIDKAGNFKSARRIMIHDGESQVETTPNTVLRAMSAAEISSWQWQWTSDSVTIDWNHRYINTLHHRNKWLERVLPVPNIDEEYDDQGYSRGVDQIPNVQGIVAVKYAYEVDHEGGTSIGTVPGDSNFSSLYLNQSHTISPPLVDGDTLHYWIRAYDIREEYLEETVTVHIDTSPPIIENLWLTRGDRLNVSVHNVDEFNQMVIEWVSYDDHSGLETVTWRLFDNYTGGDLVHGVEHISAQGEAQDMVDCESKYQTASRGPKCYCTPGVGCYHRHFQIKPRIVSANLSHGGIFHDKDKGVHDSDYYLEVTVMNHAKLTTTLDFKVTIDSSPPHTGSVHDGQRGHSEIDYQDSKLLHAHWEGFFDRESGVKFYQYGYADHCLEIRDFGLDLSSPNVTETSSTHASWTAPSEGKFYITVVAFNRALEPSLPVCSDGVTVDQTPPSLAQIVVLNSRTTEGLVRNGEEVWLVTADRRRIRIANPDSGCSRSIAPDLSQSVLYVNWTSSDAESGIYDYQLGLMSDASREAAPDILPYTSTHHHPHYEGYHPHLSEGQQVYVAVKSINKAALHVTEVLGPITVYTQAPVFTPPITVGLHDNHLVATWTAGSFTDIKQDHLTYEFTVGSSPGGSEILPFLPLLSGGGCTVTRSPSCTAVATGDLHWDLHPAQTYYVSVKVINIVGLWTIGVSDPYVHDVRLPSRGVVFDVCPQKEQELFDITDFVDSDLQLSTTTLETKWFGFDDGRSGVKYSVCIGTTPGMQNVRAYADVEESMSHKFNNLILNVNTVYYVTVKAWTPAGEVSQSSDGVRIIRYNEDVGGRVTVRDGDRCSNGLHNETTSKTSTRDAPFPIPPVAGGINITYSETEISSQLEVAMDRFRDRDIPATSESYAVMERYEWSLVDPGLLTEWAPVANLTHQGNQVIFKISFSRPLDFSKCRRLAIRGYNKVGLTTAVSADVRNCSAFDPPLVKPSLVIDATGSKIAEGIGNDIILEQNALWPMLDVDYTPYKNILSAVWPSLRHRKYKWAVVAGNRLDPTSHFKRQSVMTVSDPCALADVIKCGETGKEFVNIHFDQREELSHGQRLYVCIHADEMEVRYEKWPTVLEEVNACSDGITVDLTPPSPGSITIQGLKENVYQISTSEVRVDWSGFIDVEEEGWSSHASGIAFYHVALGSMPGEEDIREFTNVGHLHHTTLSGLQLQDGHVVYATVRVTFCAALHFSWEGVFVDEESGVKHFDVYVGSRPGHQDILVLGRVEELCTELDLSQTMKDGHSVYVTVKAYNKVSLTAFITSHALEVDTTPPSVGHVFDGRSSASSAEMKDEDYITRMEDMGAHWEGFSDPHSAVSHFLVKVGTCAGCEDTVTEFDAGASTDVVFHHIMFAEGVRYYVTVTACNMAGLCSSATSDGVILDQSPPVPGSVMDGTQDRDSQYQASRTFLGCKWHGFQDTESGLDHYEWQVGTTPGDSDIFLSQHAALKEMAFLTLNESQMLPIGKKMYITVRAFNKAGVFTTSTSNGFIIDNSAPEVVKAPDLVEGQGSLVVMTLISRSTAKVSWEVKDEESSIEKQYISISSHQLGEFNSSLMEIPGPLREYTFTQLNLHDGSHYIVKVISCNMAGLCTQSQTGGILVDSSVPTTGVLAVQTDHAAKLSRNQSSWMTWTRTSLSLAWLGFADLHSGIDHYITTVGSRPFAADLAQDPLVKVYHNISGVDLEDEGIVQTFNISTKDLSSRSSVFVTMWAVNGVGLKSSPLDSELVLGEGGELELVRRCSSYNCEGHCVCAAQDRTCGSSQGCRILDNGRELTPGLSYSVFVRAWYDENTYNIYKSDGVLIDITAPRTTSLQGTAVKEHMESGDRKDIDYQHRVDRIYLSWNNVLMDTQSRLLKYRAYTSTSPGGYSIHASSDMTATNCTVSGLSLESGTTYYSNILAYNEAGLVAWAFSDGVQIDVTAPVAGTVEDGDGSGDVDYQSSQTQVSASWFGFADKDSTISKYVWCVGSTNDPSGCSIVDWQDVGLHTSARARLESPLPNGIQVWAKVYAVDVVGHTSTVVVSDGVSIDSSPPEVKDIAYLGENLVSNPSFEESTSQSTDCHPELPSWKAGRHSCIRLLTPGVHHATHGKTIVSVRGSIQQNVMNLDVGSRYKATIHVGYPLDITVNQKVAEGFISFGNDVFTFSLDPHLCVDSCYGTDGRVILWSQYSFSFLAQNATTPLKIGTSSISMEMALDHVLLQRVDHVGNADTLETESNVKIQAVFRKHWSSVHVSWHFHDGESPLVEYTMAAGTVPGGTQVQGFKSVGRHAHGTLSGLRLSHKQKLFLTITARNAAGLTTVSRPDPITVDMTPPVFSHINDGYGMDIDYQTLGVVYVNWAVEDAESRILHCSWAIGTTQGKSDIKMFDLVLRNQTTANFDITNVNISLPLKIFTTVRCINNVGLMSSAVSDGVTLTHDQLKPTMAAILDDKVRYFHQRGQCLKNNRVRMHWARNHLQPTVIKVTDESGTYQTRVDTSYEFASLCGLHFKNLDSYPVAVSQDNVLGTHVETTLLNLTTHGNPPTIKGFSAMAVSRKGKHIFLNWDGLFDSPWKDLQYELHIGTVVGGADILEEVLTKNPEITLTLISSHSQPESLFAAVAAIDPCGYTAHYQQEITL